MTGCRIGRVRMKNGGADVRILRTPETKNKTDMGLVTMLQYVLELVRKEKVLGFSMVMRTDEGNNDPNLTMIDGVSDRGSAYALLGLMRVQEERFVIKHCSDTYDPRDEVS